MHPLSSTKTCVEVNSEFGKLKEVVIRLPGSEGTPELLSLMAWEAARLAWDSLRNPKPIARMPTTSLFGFRSRKAAGQMADLVALLEAEGCAVTFADPVAGCWDQHYVRDAGFVVGDVFFLGRLRRPDRRRESSGLARLLGRLEKVAELGEGYIEGGDVMVDGRRVLVGTGDMTDARGVESLRTALARWGIDKELVPLEYSHRGTVHLDTKFNIIGENLAIAFPGVFSRRSLRTLEGAYEIIEATAEETFRLQINCISLAPGSLAFSTGSERLAELCSRKGCDVRILDYAEVIKGGGSFRCTTLPLRRDPAGHP